MRVSCDLLMVPGGDRLDLRSGVVSRSDLTGGRRRGLLLLFGCLGWCLGWVREMGEGMEMAGVGYL